MWAQKVSAVLVCWAAAALWWRWRPYPAAASKKLAGYRLVPFSHLPPPSITPPTWVAIIPRWSFEAGWMMALMACCWVRWCRRSAQAWSFFGTKMNRFAGDSFQPTSAATAETPFCLGSQVQDEQDNVSHVGQLRWDWGWYWLYFGVFQMIFGCNTQ